jgi:exosortase
MGTPIQNRIVSQPDQSAALESHWGMFAWFVGLMLVSYAVVLGRLAKQWMTDADMSHGVFVPLLVAYVVWDRRQALAALKPTHNLFGLVLMLAGAALLCTGPPGLDTFSTVTRAAFLLSLLGVLLYLRGFSTIRMLLYPLVLLLLMFPMPGFIMERLTFPLQMIASNMAEHVLEFVGYSVLREGNILILPGQTLNIAEACSGLRSLMALMFLGQAYIYVFDSKHWMRFVMACLVVPIAVFANTIRIVASAIAGAHNRAWSQGTYHESTGWIVFVVAFICLVLAHMAVNKIYKMTQSK